MRIQLDSNTRFMNYNPLEDSQMKFMKRTIYLNSIKTNTLNNRPFEYLFLFLIDSQEDITTVTVQNMSAVTGTIHTNNDSLLRQNIYFHHGIIRQSIDKIGPNSMVEFLDMNYQSMVTDRARTRGLNNEIFSSYQLSPYASDIYDMSVNGHRIVIPDPLHYDEIDQVRGTNSDHNYIDSIQDMPIYTGKSSYSIPLSNLIDKNTVILKRNIFIENIKEFEDKLEYYPSFNTNSFVTGLVSDISIALELSGFIAGQFVFGGPDSGFNIVKVFQSFNAEADVYNYKYKQLAESLGFINDGFPTSEFRINVVVLDSSNIHVSFSYEGPRFKCANNTGIVRTSINDYIGVR